MTFYNIQINFFALYVSFYTFMAICVWMFSESDIDSVSKIKGMLVEINSKSGKIVKNVFIDSGTDSGISMEMETDLSPE